MKLTRFLSVLLIVCMLATLLVSAAGSTINTGTRHQLCENLSSQAVAYYTGDYTWDSLSAKTGGNTSCMNSMNTPLFNALNKLMASTNTASVSYNSLTSYWPTTDCSGGSSDAILFYSDTFGGGYNREHVWPKSRASFLKSNGGSDLHHLRPTNSNVNSTRGNHTMGNVRGVLISYKTYEYGGKNVLYYDASYKGAGWKEPGIVEVNDNIKGDVARILLYVWCRWKEPNLFEDDPNPVLGPGDDANNGCRVIESLDTLLQWCENDPVDTWEMSRNDCCQTIQGNRNVFIDYPEFAWLLFGQEVPDMDTPSGMAHEMQGGTSYTITAVSTDETMGTVSGSGRSYTAEPAEGYYVSGYTLVPSNAATVTQTGNTFTLTKPTEDCTLTVLFAAKEKAVLTYEVPDGVSIASINSYLGETVILGTPAGTPDDDTYTYSFVGWATAPVSVTTDKPAYLPAGSEYRLTQKNETLYALYIYTVADGDEPTDEYALAYTILDGSYVIASPNFDVMMTNDNASGTYLAQKGAVIEGNYVMNATDDCIFRIESVGDSYAIYDCNGASLFASGAKKIDLDPELTEVTADDTDHLWKISIDDSGVATITCAASASYGSLQYNSGAPRFTLYTSSQQKISLYGGITGTRYYLTIDPLNPNVCTHENTEVTGAIEPTCTETGYSGDVWCLDCGELVEEGFVLEMTDHHYVDGSCVYCGAIDSDIEPCAHENTEIDGAVEPTCTQEGYTGDTWCLDCHELVEEGTVIAALGHSFWFYPVDSNIYDRVCSACDEYFGRFYECDGLYYTIDYENPYTHFVYDSEGNLLRSEECSPVYWTSNGPESHTVYCCHHAVIAYEEPHTFENGSCIYCGEEDPNYIPPTPADPCEGYTDIDRNSWYHSAVDFVIANGYMGSTSTKELIFEPNAKVTRAMVASILYRICGSPEVEYAGKFTDVAEGAWYTKAIEWCAQNGLASGYGNGAFKPNATVSRQELAVFMYKLAEYLGKDVSGRADLSDFADASSVPAWSEKFLQWAVSAGIVSGQANGGKNYLKPADGAKRCEFASILMRFLQK